MQGYCTGIKENGVRIQIVRFTDDTAIIGQDEINLRRTLEILDDILKCNYEIKINRIKIEVMFCSKNPENVCISPMTYLICSSLHFL